MTAEEVIFEAEVNLSRLVGFTGTADPPMIKALGDVIALAEKNHASEVIKEAEEGLDKMDESYNPEVFRSLRRVIELAKKVT